MRNFIYGLYEHLGSGSYLSYYSDLDKAKKEMKSQIPRIMKENPDMKLEVLEDKVLNEGKSVLAIHGILVN